MSIAGFKSSNHPQQTSKRGAVDAVDDRGTDQTFFDSLSERFGGFTLDVAAAPHNAKCERFYTAEDDGLSQPWNLRPLDLSETLDTWAETAAERVWCNPPYSDLGSWVSKAWSEWSGQRADGRRHPLGPNLIVMLVPANRTEQRWWQEYVEPLRDRPDSDLRVEFLRGRMRFDRPGWTKPAKGDRPPFGCCLLIWSAS